MRRHFGIWDKTIRIFIAGDVMPGSERTHFASSQKASSCQDQRQHISHLYSRCRHVGIRHKIFRLFSWRHLLWSCEMSCLFFSKPFFCRYDASDHCPVRSTSPDRNPTFEFSLYSLLPKCVFISAKAVTIIKWFPLQFNLPLIGGRVDKTGLYLTQGHFEINEHNRLIWNLNVWNMLTNSTTCFFLASSAHRSSWPSTSSCHL